MSLDWITSTTIPWWGTVLLPLVTLWLGHVASSRSAERQRKADAEDRDKERTSNFNTVKEQLRSEREGEEAARRAEAERIRAERIATDFAAALAGIGTLQSALMRSAQAPPWGEYDETGTAHAQGDVAEAVPADVVNAFAANVNALRLHAGDDDITPDELLPKIHEYVTRWSEGPRYRLKPDELLNELTALAERIGGVYRNRHTL